MEVAPGGSGGDPVTPGRRTHVRLNVFLYALALLVACACVAGGVNVYRTHGQRADAAVEQERYGEVLAAAEAEAEAFINIRYDDAEGSIDQVAQGATGQFRRSPGCRDHRSRLPKRMLSGRLDAVRRGFPGDSGGSAPDSHRLP